MSLFKEFKEYSNVMLAREKQQNLSKISFKFSLLTTNILMNLGYNKRLLNSDKNKFLNIGSGNIYFEGVSNTDLFPSLGQLLKGQLKRNSNSANRYYLNLIKKEKSFEDKWEGVILSHVIEHIPPYLVLDCLSNIKKYLLTDGTLRILVPNPKVYFEDIESNKSPQGFRHNSISLNRLFYCWEHQFMFTDRILTTILEELGFTDINVTSFGKGPLGQFDADEREFESLCITAKK